MSLLERRRAKVLQLLILGVAQRSGSLLIVPACAAPGRCVVASAIVIPRLALKAQVILLLKLVFLIVRASVGTILSPCGRRDDRAVSVGAAGGALHSGGVVATRAMLGHDSLPAFPQLLEAAGLRLRIILLHKKLNIVVQFDRRCLF